MGGGVRHLLCWEYSFLMYWKFVRPVGHKRVTFMVFKLLNSLPEPFLWPCNLRLFYAFSIWAVYMYSNKICSFFFLYISFRIMVSWKGIYFILTLFWGSFFGSIFMLGPFLPLMFVNPSWYRWINNRLVATWLTLPVVS